MRGIVALLKMDGVLGLAEPMTLSTEATEPTSETWRIGIGIPLGSSVFTDERSLSNSSSYNQCYMR